jgi:hypothetical protein
MKYLRIDWPEVEEYLAQLDGPAAYVNNAYKVHKNIEEAFKAEAELRGLNLPIYVLSYDDTRGFEELENHEARVLHFNCGEKRTLVPLKNVQAIESLIPVNKALSVMDQTVKDFNAWFFQKYLNADLLRTVVFTCIVTNHGFYHVLMTSHTYRIFKELWLAQL